MDLKAMREKASDTIGQSRDAAEKLARQVNDLAKTHANGNTITHEMLDSQDAPSELPVGVTVIAEEIVQKGCELVKTVLDKLETAIKKKIDRPVVISWISFGALLFLCALLFWLFATVDSSVLKVLMGVLGGLTTVCMPIAFFIAGILSTLSIKIRTQMKRIRRYIDRSIDNTSVTIEGYISSYFNSTNTEEILRSITKLKPTKLLNFAKGLVAVLRNDV